MAAVAAAGADVNAPYLALTAAILHENHAEVDRQLAEGPEGLMHQTIEAFKGLSPLNFAVARGSVTVLKTFVKHGANLHGVDHRGKSLLWHACTHGQTEVVEWLLNEGVDPLTSTSVAAFVVACSAGRLRIIQLILDRIPGKAAQFCRYVALLSACLTGNEALARLALTGGQVDWTLEAEGIGCPKEVAMRNGNIVCARLVQEVERVYYLFKVRTLADKQFALSSATSLPLERTRASTTSKRKSVVPAFLNARVASGSPIPEVKVEMHGRPDAASFMRRKRSRSTAAAERQAVAQYVVEAMPSDVFHELIDLMRE